MISKRNGNGYTVCVGCREKNNGTGLHWDNVLYDFNDEPYCIDCSKCKVWDCSEHDCSYYKEEYERKLKKKELMNK